VTFRTYHDVAGDDRSRLLEQVTAQRDRVNERLAGVGAVVAVMSGKGGVGKSFLTAALASALARRTERPIGVLDADLRSPTVAGLLRARGPLVVADDGVEPAIGIDGIRVISTDLLLAEGRPLSWREPAAERFVWRGALEAGVLREFLGDVIWGRLDALFVDLPPGADGVVDLHALVPNLTGAIVVTIPTEESRRSVARTVQAARDDGIPLLGVIENMSGYGCPDCGCVGPLFPGDAGRQLSEEFDIPLLGTVPFHGRSTSAHPGTLVPDALTARVAQVLP
jgi:ATP-binding protein involved in chromosome partitioning